MWIYTSKRIRNPEKLYGFRVVPKDVAAAGGVLGLGAWLISTGWPVPLLTQIATLPDGRPVYEVHATWGGDPSSVMPADDAKAVYGPLFMDDGTLGGTAWVERTSGVVQPDETVRVSFTVPPVGPVPFAWILSNFFSGFTPAGMQMWAPLDALPADWPSADDTSPAFWHLQFKNSTSKALSLAGVPFTSVRVFVATTPVTPYANVPDHAPGAAAWPSPAGDTPPQTPGQTGPQGGGGQPQGGGGGQPAGGGTDGGGTDGGGGDAPSSDSTALILGVAAAIGVGVLLLKRQAP